MRSGTVQAKLELTMARRFNLIKSGWFLAG